MLPGASWECEFMVRIGVKKAQALGRPVPAMTKPAP
jgi:hypothetical protein